MGIQGVLVYLLAVAIVAAPAVTLYQATGKLLFGLLGIVVGMVLLIVLPSLGARLTVLLGGRADEKEAEHERERKRLEQPGEQFAGPFATRKERDKPSE